MFAVTVIAVIAAIWLAHWLYDREQMKRFERLSWDDVSQRNYLEAKQAGHIPKDMTHDEWVDAQWE